jgi:hypothetical protein
VNDARPCPGFAGALAATLLFVTVVSSPARAAVPRADSLASSLSSPPRPHASGSPGDSLRSSLRSPPTPRESTPAMEARSALMSGAVVVGLGYYGWAAPRIAGARDAKSYFWSEIGIGSASVGAAYLADRAWPATPAVAAYAIYGATRGIAHGLLMPDASGASSQDAEHERLGCGLAGSLSEAALDYALASELRMSADQVATVSLFGDLGMIAGDGIAQLAGPPGVYQSDVLDASNPFGLADPSRADRRRVATDIVAGGAAGQVAGALVAWREHWTEGDVSVINAATLLAGSAGAFASSGGLGGPGRRRNVAAGMLAGGAAGLVGGGMLVSGRRFPIARARAVEGATAAGAMMGLGIAALGTYYTGETASYALTGFVFGGAAAGFATSYVALLNGHDGPGDATLPSFSVSLEPAGLLALTGARSAPPGTLPPPAITLRYRLP